MVLTTTCPSIYDCNNPGELPKNEWSLIYADSEEPNDPGLAVMSFDGDPSTIWHTRWTTGDVPYPHEIQIALGAEYKISRFTYLTRQDGENGRIKEYQLFISEDSLNWGVPVKTGQFINTSAPQTIVLDTPVIGKYFRLLALSEVNGNPWASAAEFTMVGCVNYPEGNEILAETKKLTGFPVPTGGIVNITLPAGKRFDYKVISSTGQEMENGIIDDLSDSFPLNMSNRSAGIYIVTLTDNKGVIYRVRVVKK